MRLKTVAFPVEHGSWGLVLEPILLGLWVAPSWGGMGIALAAFAIFLLRHPAKLVLMGWQRQRSPRTRLAERVVFFYSLFAFVGIFIGIWQVGLYPFWPFIGAVPFLIIFAFYDLSRQSRHWQAELSGPIAFSTVAASIALAGGWSIEVAWALVGVLIARAIPSILYIRARIRLERDKSHHTSLVIIAHLLAIIFIGGLIWQEWLPFLTLFAFFVLLIRAAAGLSPYRRSVSIKTIGFVELGLGILTILAVVLGFKI